MNNNLNILINKLKKVDELFQPITKQDKDYYSPEDHIREFLEICQTQLGNDCNGLILINPVYNLFKDWSKWELVGFKDISFLAYTSIDGYQKKYTNQRIISKKGTSTKILNYINGLRNRKGNKIVIISLNENENESNPVITACNEYESNKWHFKISKNEFDKRKSLFKCEDIPPCSQTGIISPFIHIQQEEDFFISKLAEWNRIRDPLNTVYDIGHEYGIADSIFNNSIYIDEKHDIYFILSAPVYSKDLNSDLGLGGVFIILNKAIISNIGNDALLDIIGTLTDKLSIRIIHHYENQEKLKNAIRSSVGSIMARNMSHNIGSHVMPRTTIELVYNRIKKLYNNSSFKYENLPIKEQLSPINRLKQRLDNYSQEKSEFLAELTTEPLTSSKTLFFYKEVILPFIENPLLMDNIAANEDVKYNSFSINQLIIRVYIDGKEIRAKYQEGNTIYWYPDIPNDVETSMDNISGIPYVLSHIRSSSEIVPIAASTTGSDDIEIDLPGPHGEHALYGFLENLIRNSAKHNKAQINSAKEKKLEITLCLSRSLSNDNHYELCIWDNFTKSDVMAQLLELRDDSIIDNNGNISRRAWGVIEMKICSLLLQGVNDFTLLGNKSNTNTNEGILGIGSVSDCDINKNCIKYKICKDKDSLFYRLYLMKSRKVCGVILKNQDSIESKKINSNAGIYYYETIKDLLDVLSNTNHTKTLAAFKFAILDYNMIVEAINKNVLEVSESNSLYGSISIERFLKMLPFRVIIIKTTLDCNNKCDEIDALNKKQLIIVEESNLPETPEELLAWAWKKWVTDYFIYKTIEMDIYFEQEEDIEPTKQWIENTTELNKDNLDGKSLIVSVFSKNSVKNSSANTNDYLNIYYDRHGRLFKLLNKKSSAYPQEKYIYNLFDKKSSDFSLIFSPDFKCKSKKYWTFPWELAEASLLKILIIDERIAERSGDIMDIDYQNVHLQSRHQVAAAANIYICTHYINKSEDKPLHNSIEKISILFDRKSGKIKMKNYSDNSDINVIPHMIIIHQGILEQWEEEDSEFKSHEFINNIRKIIPFIIVESGRGIPPKLLKDVKFLPYSLLQEYIMGARVSKLPLAKICLALTRQN